MYFKDQIKDPRWQKKRLEILQRDEFTCQVCMSKDRTLHVHHVEYEKGKMYWDYPDISLITLCDECHKEWHRIYCKGSDDCFISTIVNKYDEIQTIIFNSDPIIIEINKNSDKRRKEALARGEEYF